MGKPICEHKNSLTFSYINTDIRFKMIKNLFTSSMLLQNLKKLIVVISSADIPVSTFPLLESYGFVRFRCYACFYLFLFELFPGVFNRNSRCYCVGLFGVFREIIFISKTNI